MRRRSGSRRARCRSSLVPPFGSWTDGTLDGRVPFRRTRTGSSVPLLITAFRPLDDAVAVDVGEQEEPTSRVPCDLDLAEAGARIEDRDDRPEGAGSDGVGVFRHRDELDSVAGVQAGHAATGVR